ncbi:MAG: aldo/keto reductase [Halieaceae bacterium]|jgi:aryl-alcohol dehydrogenase-like predicted oxidoreductase|nr:aldo/keto reductase [Halieaceae bacterium]
MKQESHSPIERFELAPGYTISRVIKGGWQLSAGHSNRVSSDPVADMRAFVARGIDTFDCADIYTGVEDAIGRYVATLAPGEAGPQIHTKYVPDDQELAALDRASVERIIDRSLRRLRVEQLDLVQFHWWNYAIPGWLEAAHWLDELRRSGKIRYLGLTNFNAEKTAALAAEVPLVSTQVQYSLLDARPEKELVGVCERNGLQLLCYGTLAGGFLSDYWLGRDEPEALDNRSLVKYRLMIEESGGWELFQELLRTLKAIAHRHGCSIATVASRWVLEQPRVAAVIIGARNAEHVERYAELFRIRLSEEDRVAIDGVRSRMNVPAHDVFDLERDREGRHGRIMKYNLNAA